MEEMEGGESPAVHMDEVAQEMESPGGMEGGDGQADYGSKFKFSFNKKSR